MHYKKNESKHYKTLLTRLDLQYTIYPGTKSGARLTGLEREGKNIPSHTKNKLYIF